MGSFGNGNFDNDSALDIKQSVIDHLMKKIDENLEPEGFGVEEVDFIVAYIDILAAVIERTCVSSVQSTNSPLLKFLKDSSTNSGLSAQTVDRWKDKVLRTYDDEIDELEPSPEYKEQRRQTIYETFVKLKAFSA